MNSLLKLTSLLLLLFLALSLTALPTHADHPDTDLPTDLDPPSPAALDARYCKQMSDHGVACAKHECNCQLCNVCTCAVATSFAANPSLINEDGSCKFGSCTQCWCSPFCNCCNERPADQCMVKCNCDTNCGKDEICWEKRCYRNEYVRFTVKSAFPHRAPVSGGVPVTLTGENFRLEPSIQCKFGSTNVVNGVFVSSTQIVCEAPAMDTAKHVRVSLSLDGGETWTKEDIRFTYLEAAQGCPTDSQGQVCSGRGTCDQTEQTCVCESGWGEEDCSLALTNCPKDTEGNVCSNHGECRAVFVNGQQTAQCQCEQGFGGADCSLPCSCGSNGICNSDGTCTCKHGFFGENCSSACPADATGKVCSGKGACRPDGSCACRYDFWGLTCSDSCPADSEGRVCGGRGHCDPRNGQCACNSGWTGIRCETRKCVNNCYARGTCDNGKCVCKGDAYGEYCQHTPSGGRGDNHGFVIFDPNAYSVSEDAKFLSVRVQRRGGSSGAVSVEVHSVATGSASEGVDYVHVHQLLQWDNEDVEDKMVLVQVLQDAEPEDAETFELQFSAPKGGLKIPTAANPNHKCTITIEPSDANVIRGFSGAVTMKFNLVYNTLADNDIARHQFFSNLVEDFAFVFKEPVSRFHVSEFKASPDGDGLSTITMQVLSLRDSPRKPSTVLKDIASALSNPRNTIYAEQRKASKSIDIRAQPIFASFSTEVIPEEVPSGLSPATIRVRTIIVITLFLGAVVFCVGLFLYYNRVKVSEYLLWKLGRFRFQKLRSVDDSDKSAAVGDLADYQPDNQLVELELGEIQLGPSEYALQEWRKEQAEERAARAAKQAQLEKLNREARKNSQPEIRTEFVHSGADEMHDVNLEHLASMSNNQSKRVGDEEVDLTVPVGPLTAKQQQQRQKAIQIAKQKARENYERFKAEQESVIPLPGDGNDAEGFERNTAISPINKRRLSQSHEETVHLTSETSDGVQENPTPQVKTQSVSAVSVPPSPAHLPVLDDGSAVQVERVDSSHDENTHLHRTNGASHHDEQVDSPYEQYRQTP